MAGYGSPPPPDQANNPNRQVAPASWGSGATPTPEMQPGTKSAFSSMPSMSED